MEWVQYHASFKDHSYSNIFEWNPIIHVLIIWVDFLWSTHCLTAGCSTVGAPTMLPHSPVDIIAPVMLLMVKCWSKQCWHSYWRKKRNPESPTYDPDFIIHVCSPQTREHVCELWSCCLGWFVWPPKRAFLNVHQDCKFHWDWCQDPLPS